MCNADDDRFERTLREVREMRELGEAEAAREREAAERESAIEDRIRWAVDAERTHIARELVVRAANIDDARAFRVVAEFAGELLKPRP